ncbi:MAG: hypothetical protein LBQ45_02565 [Mycoplasmataceae bacterium]|jgi:hypothetical protein|nr:hypothetical protein [Mycoplasmataceae bacterium]
MATKKNNKTFKYINMQTQELDRIKVEPTENINVDDINESNVSFESLSNEDLEYKLKFTKLDRKQKHEIKRILKERK